MLQPSTLARPLRPGFNKEGRAIKVLANYFKVTLNLTEAHHYDVAIVGAQTASRRYDARRTQSGSYVRASAALLLHSAVNVPLTLAMGATHAASVGQQAICMLLAVRHAASFAQWQAASTGPYGPCLVAGGEMVEAAAPARAGQPERLLPTAVCKCGACWRLASLSSLRATCSPHRCRDCVHPLACQCCCSIATPCVHTLKRRAAS